MKTYAISKFKGDTPIDFDSLPVAKITDYPNESYDYKPYAQVTVGCNEKQIALRFAAFEDEKTKNTFMTTVLMASENREDEILLIEASPEKAYVKLILEGIEDDLQAKMKRIEGEDLQGQFWGWEIMVDLEDLQNKLKNSLNFAKNREVAGNFFKKNRITCEGGSFLHTGAFLLSKFDENSPIFNQQMARFTIVDY